MKFPNKDSHKYKGIAQIIPCIIGTNLLAFDTKNVAKVNKLVPDVPTYKGGIVPLIKKTVI